MDDGQLTSGFLAKVQYAVLPICIGLAGLFAMRWRLNLMALGAEEAQAVGVNPRWETSFNCSGDRMYINFCSCRRHH